MLFTGEDSVADPDDRKPQADKFRDLAGPADVSPSRESTRRWQASQMDQQSFFVLKPPPVVMIAVGAIILALVGVGAWHYASPLLLGGIGMGALALAAIAIA